MIRREELSGRAVRFQGTEGGPRLGRVDGRHVRDAGPASSGFVPSPGAWRALAAASGPVHLLADVLLLQPVAPSKIIGVGLNYRAHALEAGLSVPSEPALFAKLPSCCIGPGEPIVLPAEDDAVDFEVELALVIGTRARRVTGAAALAAIGGYCAMNDVSGRTTQFGDAQWLRGKSFDTFGPIGPSIVDAAGVQWDALQLTTRLSGELMQASSTADMVFGPRELVEYITAAFTLYPGDVITTGTPPGVGFTRTPPRLLRAGDVVEVEVQGAGPLVNPVVRARPPVVPAWG